MTRTSSRRRTAIVLAVLVLLPLGYGLQHAGDALVVRSNVDSPDVIVMLASHEWERLPAAAELARKYPSALVLLTEPEDVTAKNCHLCAQRTNWMAAEGVPRNRIVVLPQKVKNTFSEAQAAHNYASQHGLSRVVVVTSPYHSRRALATFRMVFTENPSAVGVVPASNTSQAEPGRWWRHAYDRWYVTYEWSAIVYNRVKHGIPLS